MIVEWDVPFSLQPSDLSLEPLDFNGQVSVGSDPLGFFLLDSARCQAGSARRITRNNIAQADGEITHRKFKSGYVIELTAQLWEYSASEGKPACQGTARRMADLLDQYLESIANNDGRLVWQPSAWPVGGSPPPARMLDRARSMGPSGSGSGVSFVSTVVEKDADSPLLTVTFALLSPLPYATDAVLTTSTVSAGGTITNTGNAAYYPVLRVKNNAVRGANPLLWDLLTGFTVTNDSTVDANGNPLSIVYDSTLPGAVQVDPQDYIEIDLFLNSVELGGVTGVADRKAGIDMRHSDFWPLVPGANTIAVSGVTWSGGSGPVVVEIDWRPAWI